MKIKEKKSNDLFQIYRSVVFKKIIFDLKKNCSLFDHGIDCLDVLSFDVGLAMHIEAEKKDGRGVIYGIKLSFNSKDLDMKFVFRVKMEFNKKIDLKKDDTDFRARAMQNAFPYICETIASNTKRMALTPLLCGDDLLQKLLLTIKEEDYSEAKVIGKAANNKK